jgi:RNA polymerase sigma-70 factor (ECF subfamily)
VDESTLARIARGDRTAVAECIDRYGNLVWSLARRFTRDDAQAEDAVQEVFIDLWSHADRYDPAVAVESTFIAMIARRRLIDRLRKQKRQPGLDELTAETAVEMPDVQERLEVRDEAARAARVIATLRPEQQKVLELSVYHGMTHSGIAEALGLPIGTVKTHLRRGLIAIRDKLGVPQPSGKQVLS